MQIDEPISKKEEESNAKGKDEDKEKDTKMEVDEVKDLKSGKILVA